MRNLFAGPNHKALKQSLLSFRYLSYGGSTMFFINHTRFGSVYILVLNVLFIIAFIKIYIFIRARLYSVATYLIVRHRIFISIREKPNPTPD